MDRKFTHAGTQTGRFQTAGEPNQSNAPKTAGEPTATPQSLYRIAKDHGEMTQFYHLIRLAYTENRLSTARELYEQLDDLEQVDFKYNCMELIPMRENEEDNLVDRLFHFLEIKK